MYIVEVSAPIVDARACDTSADVPALLLPLRALSSEACDARRRPCRFNRTPTPPRRVLPDAFIPVLPEEPDPDLEPGPEPEPETGAAPVPPRLLSFSPVGLASLIDAIFVLDFFIRFLAPVLLSGSVARSRAYTRSADRRSPSLSPGDSTVCLVRLPPLVWPPAAVGARAGVSFEAPVTFGLPREQGFAAEPGEAATSTTFDLDLNLGLGGIADATTESKTA